MGCSAMGRSFLLFHNQEVPMIHFAICDDEPAQARLLSQLVSGWCAGQGEACQMLPLCRSPSVRLGG